MVVVSLSKSSSKPGTQDAEEAKPIADTPVGAERAKEGDQFHWARMAAVGSLALSGVLLMSGRRRAGLVAAVSGTALAMLDQQSSMKAWWATLPVYLDEVQLMLNRAQSAVEGVQIQRDKLHRMFSK